MDLVPESLLRPMKRKVVAVIDDNLSILGAMDRLLSSYGYDTELYATAAEFFKAAISTPAVCLIVDIQLGVTSGIDMVTQLSRAGIKIPVIFMSADCDATTKARAMKLSCVAFLTKPFFARDLIDALVQLPSSLPPRGTIH